MDGWRGTKVDPIECCRFQEEGNLWTNFSCSTRRTCITQKVIMYVWAESSPSYRSFQRASEDELKDSIASAGVVPTPRNRRTNREFKS